MNFAICISGEMRTGNIAWHRNIQYFTQGANSYSVFLETWESNSNPKKRDSFSELLLNIFLGIKRKYKEPGDVNGAQFGKLFVDFDYTEINVNETKIWDEQVNLIPNLPEGRLRRKILGSMRMFFLIEKCDQARIRYEIENKFNFDAVLRVRPDSILRGNPFEEWLHSGRDLIFFHDPNEHNFLWGPVNDQVFVGSSTAMSRISNVYTSILKVGEHIKWYLPTNGVHEVLVSESALSWHARLARSHFNINSSKTTTELLRPEIELEFMGWENWITRILDAPKLLKHFLKEFLLRI